MTNPIALSAACGAGRPKRWRFNLLGMLATRRTRIALSHLSDDQLRDIGLTHEDVETELARPIWDVPVHWRRQT